MTHDQLMKELAHEVAREMPVVYAENGKPNVTEMYHLQPATDRVVARVEPVGRDRLDWHPVK